MIELIHRLKKKEITKDVFIVEFTNKYNILNDYNRIKAIMDLIDIYMDEDSTILKDLIHLPDFKKNLQIIEINAKNHDNKDIFKYDNKDIGFFVKNIKTNKIFKVCSRINISLCDENGISHSELDCEESNIIEFRKYRLNLLLNN